MNLIELAGHLGADAEEKLTPNGRKLLELRMAVRVRRSGQDETMWFRVTFWDPERFERMIPYLKKGSGCIIVGEMQKPRVYTDREGQPQISLEVTGELIRFSPFGRASSPEGDMQAGTSTPFPAGMSAPVQPASIGSDQVLEEGTIDDDNLPF